ncbi:Heparinase II/III family protein [Desulfonema limicola]|uniref:Heparinase II/III family protein n=1 Tax=Desulfonema limicola TaxID=45656 RepID=A0A975B5F9_9BACT|nr:alginate lyase family protein [Desulfonema limicola]QTA79117.1 Heparinase II/III family protein [Desulfonema limicola]
MLNKIKKLKNMPREEIFFRFQEKALELYEMIRHISGRDLLDEKKWAEDICGLTYDSNFKQKLFERFVNTKADFFFTESYEKTKRCKLIKEKLEWKDWISEADDILKGNIVSLGCQMKIPSGKSWHLDPVKGKPWPEKFYKQAENAGDMKACDIKYVWEISRHQYLVVLAKAFRLTGDEKYAEKIFTILQNWIAANPYHSGVNWSSSLELAVRMISWIWALFFCKDSKFLTPDICALVLKSIYEHGRHISNHLSYYSSPYNHLTGEAAALYLTGALFPVFKESKTWKKTGWDMLEDNVEKQFHEDGMCVEQALFYHHFTLGFYLQALLLKRLHGENVSESMLNRLEKALEFSMHASRPDSRMPMIGDIDNARSLYFSGKHSWDFRGFTGIGAILFQRPDFKYISGESAEEIYWLFTDKEIHDFLMTKETRPAELSKAFYKSGYFIFRDSWTDESNYLCFDCGETACGLSEDDIPSAAHGHADALSFQLSAFGSPILTDGGFYTYSGEEEWHRYFRQEEAHNTIRCGNKRQAVYGGRFKWKQVKNPVLTSWNLSEYLEIAAGRIDYDARAFHQREVVYIKNYFWLINDLVNTEDDDNISCFFHFDPDAEIIIDEINQQITACNGDKGLIIKYFKQALIKSRKGEISPGGGWTAWGYGMKKPSYCIEMIMDAKQERIFSPLLMIPWKKSRDGISFQDYDLSQTDFSAKIFIKGNEFLVSRSDESGISVLMNGEHIS